MMEKIDTLTPLGREILNEIQQSQIKQSQINGTPEFKEDNMSEELKKALKLTIEFLDVKMEEGPRPDIAAASNLLEDFLSEDK